MKMLCSYTSLYGQLVVLLPALLLQEHGGAGAVGDAAAAHCTPRLIATAASWLRLAGAS
jgi:hypothetical protein